MGKCTYDTVLYREIVVAIPLQVLVSMGWFLQYTFMQRELSASGLTKVSRKGDGPILLITFDTELYSWIYTVYMIQKKLLVGLLLDNPCIIQKPVPKPWW